MINLFIKPSLNNYFREIGAVELLSPEEEIEITNRIKQNDRKAL